MKDFERLLKQAISMNMLVFDNKAEPGELTSRLFVLMKCAGRNRKEQPFAPSFFIVGRLSDVPENRFIRHKYMQWPALNEKFLDIVDKKMLGDKKYIIMGISHRDKPPILGCY